MCAVLRRCIKLWALGFAFFFRTTRCCIFLGEIFARVCGGIDGGAVIDETFLFSCDCDGRKEGGVIF